ncbi:methyltransferase domain-containing protein [Inquilinus limosus]|uniref:methyltransferase domain-containing protein n=1 Tax=Inquilinus limosus TaxID=171674 RepID=UPI003F5CC4DB
MPDVPYILGHSEAELRRLSFQAAILKPITRRLLLEAGLAPGMRVLDLGCGTGDVSLLAAELVGPIGAVVGIDRSAAAVAAARNRARSCGHGNVIFHQAEAEAFDHRAPFDLVIGRYVLMHQADPAAMIRAAAAHARPGGAVAFHEVATYGECPTWPPNPLLAQIWDWITKAFASVAPHRDAAGRLIEHFHRAGLLGPTLFGEAAVAAHCQVVGPTQFCAWARV